MRSLERRRESSYSRAALLSVAVETVSGVSGAGGSPPTARSFSAFLDVLLEHGRHGDGSAVGAVCSGRNDAGILATRSTLRERR